MSHRPYPSTDRARHQIARHPRPKPPTVGEQLEAFSAACNKLSQGLYATAAAWRGNFTTRA